MGCGGQETDTSPRGQDLTFQDVGERTSLKLLSKPESALWWFARGSEAEPKAGTVASLNLVPELSFLQEITRIKAIWIQRLHSSSTENFRIRTFFSPTECGGHRRLFLGLQLMIIFMTHYCYLNECYSSVI